MNRLMLRLYLAATASAIGAAPAFAQDSSPTGATDAACAEGEMTVVAPRIGISSDSLRGHDEVTGVSPNVVMYGASVTGRLPCRIARNIPLIQAGNFAAALTGGEKNENGVHSERLVGEFFLMAPTNEYFGFAAGYRYERAADSFDIAPASGVASVETELHSLRIGVAGTLPLFQTYKSRMFSAFYLAGGVQTSNVTDVTTGESDDEEFFAGPEVMVGYAVDISKELVFDIRYRTALYATDFSGRTDAQTENALFVSLGYQF